MAVTVSATQADNAAGWTAVGDPHWVPDVGYYRRFVLSCSGPEVAAAGHIVNWEIYDSKAIPFVANAATVTVQATGGAYTDADAPAFLNNKNTQTIWVRNAKAPDAGAPYYTETGTPWVSSLRANGPRVTVELPVSFKWAEEVVDTATFEVAAYLPGGGKVPAGYDTITVNNPKVADLKTILNEAASEPEPLPEAETEPEETPVEAPPDEPEPVDPPEPGPVAPLDTPADSAPVLPDPPESYPDWADSLAVLAWVGDDKVRAAHAEKEVRSSGNPDNDLISQLDLIAYPPEGVKPPEAYDPGWTVTEVKAWVGDDVDRALEAYTREQMRGAGMRSTLIEWLTPILAHVPQ